MVSVVITNYNTSESLCECIRAVISLDNHDQVLEIIVVDDCSTETLPAFIFEVTKLQLIVNDSNLGYVKSVNIGLASCTCDYIILLDSDALLLTSIHQVIYPLLNNKELQLIGSKSVDKFGKQNGSSEPVPTNASLILGHQLHFFYHQYYLRFANKKSCVHSFAIVIRKELLDKIGFFDETFDFLDADIDFSIRTLNYSANAVGVNSFFLVQHEGYGSAQSVYKRYLRFYKNRTYLLLKHRFISNSFPLYMVIFRLKIEKSIFKLAHYFIYDKTIYKSKILARADAIYIVEKQLKNFYE